MLRGIVSAENDYQVVRDILLAAYGLETGFPRAKLIVMNGLLDHLVPDLHRLHLRDLLC